jgi:hypothetical protein
VYTRLRTGSVDASRAAAMSGMRPMKKKTELTVRYVVTANTSHSSGLRKLGQMWRWLGSGSSQ